MVADWQLSKYAMAVGRRCFFVVGLVLVFCLPQVVVIFSRGLVLKVA